MKMKKFTTITCFVLFCNVIFAQNSAEQRIASAFNLQYQEKLKRLNQEIEGQKAIMAQNESTISTLRGELQASRNQYDKGMLKAYDMKKILEMDEYLRQSFSKMENWRLVYMLDIAKKYPNDTLFSKRAERIETTIKSKNVYDEAFFQSERLQSLKFDKKQLLTTPFKYQDIDNYVNRLNDVFNSTNDTRIQEMGRILYGYERGIYFFSELIDNVQIIRQGDPHAKWNEYEVIFAQLEKEKKDLDEEKRRNPSVSTKSRLERIESLPYLKDCLKQLKDDLKKSPSKESSVEALIYRIRGNRKTI